MQLWEKLNELDGHHWSIERRIESLRKVHRRIATRCPNAWIRHSKVVANCASPLECDRINQILTLNCSGRECDEGMCLYTALRRRWE